MEHVNPGSGSRPEQHHHQQFCLRWHNHQTSLLSSLPILLDQSHLTDVTLSAEGRTLRAHRVVLSACSTFFLELFRALDSSNHPVIIIPGASFAAIVALLTFMYSGEVNVFEEQIPTLLNLAETLGIKGLADVQSNLHSSNSTKKADDSPLQVPPPHQMPQGVKDEETPAPPTVPLAVPPTSSMMTNKLPTPLENFFLKSLQFYPNLIPQPLNFSQSALNKTSEFLAKYQQQCGLYHSSKENDNFVSPTSQSLMDDGGYNKRTSSGEKKTKDIKRIDKIVESLRCATQSSKPMESMLTQTAKSFPDLAARSPQSPMATAPSFTPKGMSNFLTNSGTTSGSANSGTTTPQKDEHDRQSSEKTLTENSGTFTPSRSTPNAIGSGSAAMSEGTDKMASSPQPKISNSKLYATCFICHKQLSNQYNLRVHLETHQNVRYACNVCSHVSRSKDALRKHVSYRHPGAPSPCETEARRKRAKGLSTTFPLTTPTDQDQMAAQLSPAFMFMPNQFHLTSTPPSQMTALSTLTTSTSGTSAGSENALVKRECTTDSPNDHHQNSTTTYPSDSAAKP